MTRLVTKDIQDIRTTFEDNDRSLLRQTGYTLKQIAVYAAGAEGKETDINSLKVAIIPFRSGEGIIEGFSQTVASILEYIGFSSFVTALPDAGGIAEAVQKGANILMMADDDRFMAVNLSNHKISDNSAATGRGYAAALEMMAGGLHGRKVLLIGAGAVGTSAGLALAHYGAQIVVYDVRTEASINLAALVFTQVGRSIVVEHDLEKALQAYRIVYDASPAEGFIDQRHIGVDMVVAAPGMPLGVKADCLEMMSGRIIHDPLQIGVATMLFDVL